MQHRAIGIALAFCLVPFSFPSAVLADAETFKERCMKCHARASTLARSIEGNTLAEKTAWLVRYLETHHVDDAAERAKLAAYLVGLSAK